MQIFTPFLASASRRTQCETGAKRQSGHGRQRLAEFAVRTAATAPAGAQPMSIGTKSSRRRDGGYDAILAAASFRGPSSLLGLGFCFYGSWISTKAQEGGRAQHTTLAHMGMGTQNILENPKMHLQ